MDQLVLNVWAILINARRVNYNTYVMKVMYNRIAELKKIEEKEEKDEAYITNKNKFSNS